MLLGYANTIINMREKVKLKNIVYLLFFYGKFAEVKGSNGESYN